jgi:hypothetical protein
MSNRMKPPMRRLLLTALLVTGACEQQRPPIPITYVPQGATPAAAGTPEEIASRRLNRAMAGETRQDARQDADPYAGSMAGTPTPSTDMQIGGGEYNPVEPEIAIPFSGI